MSKTLTLDDDAAGRVLRGSEWNFTLGLVPIKRLIEGQKACLFCCNCYVATFQVNMLLGLNNRSLQVIGKG